VTDARDESPVWSSSDSELPSPLAVTFTMASPPVMHTASPGQRESPVTPSKRSLTPRPCTDAVSPGANVKRASRETVGPVGDDSSQAVAARRQKTSVASLMFFSRAEVMPAASCGERRVRCLELEPERDLVVVVEEAVPVVHANGPAAAQPNAKARAEIEVATVAGRQPARHPGRIEEHRDPVAEVLPEGGQASGTNGFGIGRAGRRSGKPVLSLARAVHDGAAHHVGPEIPGVLHQTVGAQRHRTGARIAA